MLVAEIAKAWASGQRTLSGTGLLDLRDLWDYREYTWTRNNSRAGMVKLVDGTWEDLRGPEKWDAIKESLAKNGWDPKEPAWLAVGRDGTALVVEGNHRMAIAQELNMKKVPVKVEYRDSVRGGKKASLAERVAYRWMDKVAINWARREQEWDEAHSDLFEDVRHAIHKAGYRTDREVIEGISSEEEFLAFLKKMERLGYRRLNPKKVSTGLEAETEVDGIFVARDGRDYDLSIRVGFYWIEREAIAIFDYA